jgi:hypothetical protein
MFEYWIIKLTRTKDMFLSVLRFLPDAVRIRSPPPAILTFPHEHIFLGSSLRIFADFRPFMTAEKYRDILDCSAPSSINDFLYGGRRIECGSKIFVRDYTGGRVWKSETHIHQKLFHPFENPWT